jgi:hypothetical protein
VRARHPQTILRIARSTAAPVYPSIEAAVSAAARAQIEAAIPAAWLPIEIDVEVMEAIAGKLGPATTAQLVAARQREEMGSALFNTFVQTVLRLSGATPATVVKQLNAGWKQLFRDCGTIDVLEVGERHARVIFRDLPRVCVASAAWMSGIPAGMGMLYELIGMKGTAELEGRGGEKGTTLLFRWEPR